MLRSELDDMNVVITYLIYLNVVFVLIAKVVLHCIK